MVCSFSFRQPEPATCPVVLLCACPLLDSTPPSIGNNPARKFTSAEGLNSTPLLIPIKQLDCNPQNKTWLMTTISKPPRPRGKANARRNPAPVQRRVPVAGLIFLADTRSERRRRLRNTP